MDGGFLMLLNKDEAFKKLYSSLPTWMNGRKRPEKSVTGKFFQSISDEQTNLNSELQKVIDSFFLMNYIGKENTVMSHVYIAAVGLIDTSAIITNIDTTITEDAYLFLSNKSYSLLQDGILIFHEDTIKEQQELQYTYNESNFRTAIIKKPVWNIFDEFARFSCLERYDGESNAELTQRCLAVFRNPTNSTSDGLKNAIVNAIMNYVLIDKDSIAIEIPSEDNMYILDGGEPLYEKLSKENMDIMRTKIWDETNWENIYAEIDYITNIWDKKIEQYQSGTGNGLSLKPFIADNIQDEKTNVSVMPYKVSQILIDSYIRRHNIKKNIPLKLKKYKDEISPRNFEYKIIASPAYKIDADNIFVKAQKSLSGIYTHNLSDIIMDPGELTVSGGGAIQPDTEYVLKIYPETDMDFNVYKAVLKESNGAEINLLKNQGDYVLNDNNVLTNRNIRAHIDSTSKMKTATNILNLKNGGFTLDDKTNEGIFSFDVSDMAGSQIKISSYCDMTDYTSDINLVKVNGFKLTEPSTWESNSTNSSDHIEINMSCSEISFELAMDPDPKKQGSVMISCSVDDSPYSPMCGLFSKDKRFYASFGSMKNIAIKIKKMGMYPVKIKNINAVRYEFDMTLDKGIIAHTKTGMILSGYSGQNTLHFTIRNYGNRVPVISYIHIGNQISEPYIISGIRTSDKKACLDINTDKKMNLYKVINGKEQAIELNYSTRKTYQNKTNHIIMVPIKTENFIKINKSSKEITQQLYEGNLTSCISIGVGETVYDIEIDGTTLITKFREPLTTLLDISGDNEIYVSSQAPGFIIKADSGNTIKTIRKQDFPSDANIIVFENVPANMNGIFITDNIRSEGTRFERDFESAYISCINSEQYIAYNKCSLIQNPTDTTMSENFFPMINTLDKLLFYCIDEISTTFSGKIDANFVNGTNLCKWTLGKNLNIRITYDRLTNETDCLYDVHVLNEAFEISNTIKLNPIYYQDANDYELARWIITPPEDMVIEYEQRDTAENIIIKDDGINKLYYSNIINISEIIVDDKTISADEYDLMKTQGILFWLSNKYVGSVAEIRYSYNAPRAIAYKDILSLYDMVGYSNDAYKPMINEPIIYKNIGDKETRTIILDDNIPDKITATCSNPNFSCIINGNKIKVVRSDTNGKILIHNGYYYDGNEEYFMFESLHKEEAKKKDNVKYNNVIKASEKLICMQFNDNYVKNSRFNPGLSYKPVCRINPEYTNIAKGISTSSIITACDSFQLWNTYEMSISIVKAYNDNALKFTPTDDDAYAILDITSLLVDRNILSFYASKELNIYIMREVFTDDNDSMSRSIYCEEYAKISASDNNEEYREYICENIPKDTRFYLMIQGEGIIDDIISTEYNKNNIPVTNHAKNISLLGFDIEEDIEKNSLYPLEFDINGNDFDGLEMNERGVIDTGSTADWGLTRKVLFENDFSHFGLSGGAYIKKNVIRTDSNSGQVRSPKFFIDNTKSVLKAYVKINNVLKKSLKNFKITLRGSDTGSSNWIDIKMIQKGNLLEVSGDSIKSYLQIVVDMDSQKVITNIEMYIKYAEIPGYNLHIVPTETGYMTTKIYNTGIISNWKFHGINGDITDASNITIEMRGCRVNDKHAVWTQWYACDFADNISNNHIFDDYGLFQFRIHISNPKSKLRIENFILEAV